MITSKISCRIAISISCSSKSIQSIIFSLSHFSMFFKYTFSRWVAKPIVFLHCFSLTNNLMYVVVVCGIIVFLIVLWFATRDSHWLSFAGSNLSIRFSFMHFQVSAAILSYFGVSWTVRYSKNFFTLRNVVLVWLVTISTYWNYNGRWQWYRFRFIIFIFSK